MFRAAGIDIAQVPMVAAGVAMARIDTGRPDDAETVVDAHPVTVAATMPAAGPRRARPVLIALDDRSREAAGDMAGVPLPSAPSILSPDIVPPPRDGLVTAAPRVPASVVLASPKGLITVPAGIDDGAAGVAVGAAWTPPMQQSPVSAARIFAPSVPPDGLAPAAQLVLPVPAPVPVAVPPIVDGADTLALVAASTPLQPVMTQAPLPLPAAATAAPPADAAAAVEARSPAAVVMPARTDQSGSALAGADRSVTGPLVSRAAAAPAEPAQSSGDGRGNDRRDGRDRPIRSRAVAAGLLAPVEPGRPQPITAAFALPIAAERAAAPAVPAASMAAAMALDGAATAMTVTTEQLGAVSVGVDDDAGHLRVRLSGSTLAMDTMAAQAPRLIAELAATGVRLGTLDIAGRVDSGLAPAASVSAPVSTGDATSDQRAAGGQSGADAFMGGGADARGQPSGEGRARSAAGIALLARGGIAGDPLAAPRFSPSDRYA